MQLVERRASAEFRDVLIVRVQLAFADRQFAHDAEEPLNRDRRRAVAAHLRFHAASDRHVEVRSGEVQPTIIGPHVNVRENGQRRAVADDVLHGLQARDELVFGDAQFHGY